MKKCLIIYYSQNGTTAKIADRISSTLQSGDFIVDSVNLKNSIPENISGYDVIGIGSPVHYYQPSHIILNFLKNLPDLDKKPVFIFLLYGTYSFNSYKYIDKILSKKNARVLGYSQFKGEGLFLGYIKNGFLFSPDRPDRKDLKDADFFAMEIIDSYEHHNSLNLPENNSPGIIYRIENLLFNKWICSNIYSRFFKSDETRCNDCGLCIRSCPVKNIVRNDSGTLTWGRECVACFSCHLLCPNESISSPAGWYIMTPFIRYNTRNASNDPLIKHVKVLLENGKIKKIKPAGSARN